MFVRGYLRASTKDQDASRARKHGVQDHGPPPEADGQTHPASSMRGKRHKFATGPSLKGPPSAGRRGNLAVALAAPTPADIHRPSNEAPGRTQDMARQCSQIHTRPLHRRILYRVSVSHANDVTSSARLAVASVRSTLRSTPLLHKRLYGNVLVTPVQAGVGLA